MKSEEAAPAVGKRTLGSRLVGLAVAVVGLLWLWGGDGTQPLEYPPVVQSIEEARKLEAGSRFWMEGVVEPVVGTDLDLWKGRFAYREAAGEKDEWGSWNVVVEKQVRPEVLFRWADGMLTIPADSYDLSEAPDVTNWVNDHSRGFVSGDPAVAIGNAKGEETAKIVSLAVGPVERLIEERRENVESRGKIGLVLKMGGTFLLVVIGVLALRWW